MSNGRVRKIKLLTRPQIHYHKVMSMLCDHIYYFCGFLRKNKLPESCSCIISSGQLMIYVLKDGQIHISSQCIVNAKHLLKQYTGLVVEGKLVKQYKDLDERFKIEIQNRINLIDNNEEILKMKSIILKLNVINYDNGKAVKIEIIK